MLSLYEILKASKTGIAPDMWTALAGMNWGGAGSGAETKELTGIPPLSFTADGTPLLDYLISGNMSQSGTPTPQNPIQPSECGDLETTGEHAGQYKIPISSANTTTPVYLGEVETVRQIRKLVLTGQETFGYANRCFTLTFDGQSASVQPKKKIIFCNVYDGVAPVYRDKLRNYQCCITRNYNQLAIRDDNHADESAFKSYLAQQYAAGTPVCVWYVLETPEIAVVNEPLRKIGDYADTVSMEQAQVQIPTLHGNTVIDVLTELKPSEMYIKYQE